MRIVSIIASAILGCAVTQSGDSADPKPREASATSQQKEAKVDVRLITLNPGHFHAALIQRDQYPNVSPEVHVYAPLGQDLVGHLQRVARFNQRQDNPTRWSLQVHAGPQFVERMLVEKPGNVVVISGRNRGKIELIRGSVGAGLHALADKPWIIDSTDLVKLQQVLDLADEKGLVAFDIMTERFEATNMLQRELVSDPELFGRVETGSPEDPAVYMESVHHLMKTVAGAPNIRPAWFFDTKEQGEGLSDIGTHLVDLVHWSLFPEQTLNATEIELVAAQRWPTRIPLEDFRRVTGEPEFPSDLKGSVENGVLDCFSNTLVSYTVRKVHVQLNVIWDWEAPAGAGDTHFAVYRGSKARIEIRQGPREKWRPELYVVPREPALEREVTSALSRRIEALAARFPGLSWKDEGGGKHVIIPDQLRTSHEEHFGEVARRFFGYLERPGTLPAWEKPNMLAKYWVTTKGTELSRQSPPESAERRAPR
jgi:predicted dehydrogenase